jgi:hypothetical protein
MHPFLRLTLTALVTAFSMLWITSAVAQSRGISQSPPPSPKDSPAPAKASTPAGKEVDLSGQWMIDDEPIDLKLNAEMSKVRKVYCGGDRMTQLKCLWVAENTLRYEVSNQGFALLNCSATYEPDAPEMKGSCLFGNRPTPKGFTAKRIGVGAIAQGRGRAQTLPSQPATTAPKQELEPWQTSYPAYMDQLAATNMGDIRSRFGDKALVWEGTFQSFDSEKNAGKADKDRVADLEIKLPEIKGAAGPIIVFRVHLFSKASSSEKWKDVKQGSRVQFRGVLITSLPDQQVISGVTIRSYVHAIGDVELVKILPD